MQKNISDSPLAAPCPVCGTALAPDAAECPVCGCPVEEAAAAGEVTPPVVEQDCSGNLVLGEGSGAPLQGGAAGGLEAGGGGKPRRRHWPYYVFVGPLVAIVGTVLVIVMNDGPRKHRSYDDYDDRSRPDEETVAVAEAADEEMVTVYEDTTAVTACEDSGADEVRAGIAAFNAQCPMKLGDGLVAVGARLDAAGNIVYQYSADENELDLAALRENRRAFVSNYIATGRGDADGRALLDYCKRQGCSIVCAFKGDTSGEVVRIVITPEDM